MAKVEDIDIDEAELLAMIDEMDATGEEISKTMPVPEPRKPVVSGDDDIETLEELEESPPAAKVEAVEEIQELEELEEVAEAAASTPAVTPKVVEPATVAPASTLSELDALEAALDDIPVPKADPASSKPKPKPTVEPVAIVEVPTPAPEAIKPAKPLPTIEEAPPKEESKPEPLKSMDAPLKPRAPAPLQFYIDPKEFNAETAIKETDLDTCMMQQSSLRAFYGAQAAQAEAQHSRMKARFDVLEAKLYDQHRRGMAALGEKVTEKMVDNAVKLDPRWLALKNDVIEAETIASVNKNMVYSLTDRRDMLIQMGSDRRAESQGQVRIMAAKEEQNSLTARAVNAAREAMGGNR